MFGALTVPSAVSRSRILTNTLLPAFPSKIPPRHMFSSPVSSVAASRQLSSVKRGGSKPAMEKIDPKDTIFAKIVAGTIPSKKVYEDEHTLAFHDINPQAPVHVLVIPKTPIGGIGDTTEQHKDLLGNLFFVATKVAKTLNIADDGYRLVVNEGPHGQQSVRWLHVHILGGRQLTWPPG